MFTFWVSLGKIIHENFETHGLKNEFAQVREDPHKWKREVRGRIVGQRKHEADKCTTSEHLAKADKIEHATNTGSPSFGPSVENLEVSADCPVRPHDVIDLERYVQFWRIVAVQPRTGEQDEVLEDAHVCEVDDLVVVGVTGHVPVVREVVCDVDPGQ